MGARFLAIPSGKVYYEAEVVRAKGCAKVGFGGLEAPHGRTAVGPPVAADAGYAQYLQATLREGDKVIGVAGERKGDIGTYVGNSQSAPPCIVQWQSDGKQLAVFWKDVEINCESADVRFGVHRSS